jgi:uncharacterized membrane protein
MQRFPKYLKNYKNNSLTNKSIILFTILIIISAIIIITIIYFTFFRKMDEELRQIEREYPVVIPT